MTLFKASNACMFYTQTYVIPETSLQSC